MKKGRKDLICTWILIGSCTLAACGLSGCDSFGGKMRQQEAFVSDEETSDHRASAEQAKGQASAEQAKGQALGGACRWDALVCDGRLELTYAEKFSVDRYGEYRLVTIGGADRFLIVPDGQSIPDGLPDDITAVRAAPERIYLVSSSVMDFFIRLEALSSIRLSGTKAGDWHLDEAREAMEQGAVLYAGKYSAPDYELILDEGCDLAIENTMIYHNPEVKEQLEKLGIPVIVERSSYESHPLGRLEWIKLYGVLLGKEEQAGALYESWLAELEPVLTQENTGCTVAFFYITKSGAVSVRKSGDYVARMIELAGGSYVFSALDAEEDNALSSRNIQMEEFYAAARDADYLIYNSTIDEELYSLQDLLTKSSLLADFKAVREGHVYCTGKNFFQETSGMGQFIQELHGILSGEKTQAQFLRQLY